jgi:hypothetical protein
MPKHDLKPFKLAGGVASIKLEVGTDGKPKLGTFSGRAYTGAVMNPNGWGNLILDLNGARIPSQHRPTLRQHDHEQITGHTETVKASKDGIDVAGVFSGQKEHVEKVTIPASNGFKWQLSIGGNPIRLSYLKPGEEAEVNGRTVTGPLEIAHEWELGEISFVPLGADGDTSVSVAASQRRGKQVTPTQIKAALKALKLARYADEDIDAMKDDEAKAALKRCMAEDDGAEDEKKRQEKAAKKAAKAAEDEEMKNADEDEKDKKTEARIAKMLEAATQKGIEAARKATADELDRTAFAAKISDQYGLTTIEIEENGKKRTVNFQAHSIGSGWSKEKIELEALRNARPGPDVGRGPFVYSTSTPEMDEAVIECGLLQGLRHTYRLDDDDFWTEQMGESTIRRHPKHIENEVRRDIKSRYTEKVQEAAHKTFKGRLSFQQALDIAFHLSGSRRRHDWKTESSLRSNFKEWEYLENSHPSRFEAEGSSTITIGNILSNVLNKFALQGYLFVESAWRSFCGIIPVNDFKAAKSINLLGDVVYQMVGKTGELANFSLQDQAFANQAFMFGKIGTIPWQSIVDDDLGILQRIPEKLGQGAGLALNDMIWSLMTSLVNASIASGGSAGNIYGAIQTGATITADDGNAFFRTTTNLPGPGIPITGRGGASQYYNKNKFTGGTTALSATSLGTAKAGYDNQIDPNGNPLGYDGAKPRLLIGPTNWQTARGLMQADLIVSGNSSNTWGLPNRNVWNNYADIVLSRYIENANYINSTTPWFLFFDPSALAAMQVCFLNGVDTPAVLTAGPDFNFDRLGISVRGTMPFGVTQQNFRGVVYMAGA